MKTYIIINTTEVGLVNYKYDNILELKRIDTNDLPKSRRSKISEWTKIIKNGR